MNIFNHIHNQKESILLLLTTLYHEENPIDVIQNIAHLHKYLLHQTIAVDEWVSILWKKKWVHLEWKRTWYLTFFMDQVHGSWLFWSKQHYYEFDAVCGSWSLYKLYKIVRREWIGRRPSYKYLYVLYSPTPHVVIYASYFIVRRTLYIVHFYVVLFMSWTYFVLVRRIVQVFFKRLIPRNMRLRMWEKLRVRHN